MWIVLIILYAIGFVGFGVADLSMRWRDYERTNNNYTQWYVKYARPKIWDSLLVGAVWPIVAILLLINLFIKD